MNKLFTAIVVALTLGATVAKADTYNIIQQNNYYHHGGNNDGAAMAGEIILEGISLLGQAIANSRRTPVVVYHYNAPPSRWQRQQRRWYKRQQRRYWRCRRLGRCR